MVEKEEALVAGFVAGFEGTEVGGEEGADDVSFFDFAHGTGGDAVAEPAVPAGDGVAVPAEGCAEEGGVATREFAGDGALEVVEVDGLLSVDVGVEGREPEGVEV